MQSLFLQIILSKVANYRAERKEGGQRNALQPSPPNNSIKKKTGQSTSAGYVQKGKE